MVFPISYWETISEKAVKVKAFFMPVSCSFVFYFCLFEVFQRNLNGLALRWYRVRKAQCCLRVNKSCVVLMVKPTSASGFCGDGDIYLKVSWESLRTVIDLITIKPRQWVSNHVSSSALLYKPGIAVKTTVLPFIWMGIVRLGYDSGDRRGC